VADAFFDTNVLLYLVSSDAAKADIAEATIASGGHVSVQVLNEFVAVARSKARLDWAEIDEVLRVVREVCTVHSITLDSHDAACELSRRHKLHVYDASIVASASLAGCDVFYSEDFQHGQRFGGGLRVRNPFR
jgi:predicted nucleic acid-binding protein